MMLVIFKGQLLWREGGRVVSLGQNTVIYTQGFIMSSTPRYTALAANLPSAVPFVAPEKTMRKTGRAFSARLGANENGFGPSPQVATAILDAMDQIWTYPDPDAHDLRMAIAAHLDIGCGICW